MENIISEECFDSLNDNISEKTAKAIKEMGFEKMTKIQAKTIPTLLEGK
jgi:ATP-dependent RNA helicase pitchoune, putative (fragment)